MTTMFRGLSRTTVIHLPYKDTVYIIFPFWVKPVNILSSCQYILLYMEGDNDTLTSLLPYMAMNKEITTTTFQKPLRRTCGAAKKIEKYIKGARVRHSKRSSAENR